MTAILRKQHLNTKLKKPGSSEGQWVLAAKAIWGIFSIRTDEGSELIPKIQNNPRHPRLIGACRLINYRKRQPFGEVEVGCCGHINITIRGNFGSNMTEPQSKNFSSRLSKRGV